MSSAESRRIDVVVSEFIQKELRRRGLSSVTAVEAAGWLDRAGILPDSTTRLGRPLRDKLRKEMILGQRQESGHWWHIDLLDPSELK